MNLCIWKIQVLLGYKKYDFNIQAKNQNICYFYTIIDSYTEGSVLIKSNLSIISLIYTFINLFIIVHVPKSH